MLQSIRKFPNSELAVSCIGEAKRKRCLLKIPSYLQALNSFPKAKAIFNVQGGARRLLIARFLSATAQLFCFVVGNTDCLDGIYKVAPRCFVFPVRQCAKIIQFRSTPSCVLAANRIGPKRYWSQKAHYSPRGSVSLVALFYGRSYSGPPASCTLRRRNKHYIGVLLCYVEISDAKALLLTG